MENTPPPLIDKRLVAVLIIAAIAATMPFLFAGGKSNIVWQSDFTAAGEQARQQQRPMFVYFTADWCPPCQKMKQHVFPDANVERTLNEQFIPVMIDLSDPGQSERVIADRFGIEGIPTMVITNGSGAEKDRHVGGTSAEMLVKWLKQFAAR